MNPFPRPGEAPEPESGDVYLEKFAGKLEAADIFRRLFLMCIPARSYGETRRFEAGYRRMVVMAWVVAPEIFEGMLVKHIARELGITDRAFRKQAAEVCHLLASRRAGVAQCASLTQKTAGPSQAPHPAEVPREASGSACVVKSK